MGVGGGVGDWVGVDEGGGLKFKHVWIKKRIKNKKKGDTNFFQFCMVKKVFEFFVKMEECTEKQKEKRQVWTQIFEKSREYGNFKNSAPPPPTWDQNFKPIRKLLTNFEHIYSKCTT